MAAFGQENYVYDGDNLAAGGFNTVFGWANLVAGDSNYLANTASATITAESTAMFGLGNYGDNLTACLVSGSFNQIDTATDSAAIGHGLILGAGTQARIVVGQYNVPAAAGARFIVANGSDSNHRSNAFTVFANGDASVSGALSAGGQPVVTATTFPTYLGNANIAFSSGSNRSISINTSSTGAGNSLTIRAGSAASGQNLTGGNLILSSGNSTGGVGSAIEFRAAAAGTPGTGVQTAALRMKINIAGGIEAGIGLMAAAAPQFVLGKYNNTVSDAKGNHGEGLVVIGAGTGPAPAARINAMRVLDDGNGTILIRQQGDLLMGSFMGGEQP